MSNPPLFTKDIIPVTFILKVLRLSRLLKVEGWIGIATAVRCVIFIEVLVISLIFRLIEKKNILLIIIVIYLPRTHTTHNVQEEQIAYSRCDKAEIQH